MTTNPNNAVGTNAAYSGRTSVNAFNDDLAAYSRGILTGWNCQVDTGLTVILGGGHSVRDVAIAEDNAGNKTTINNISLDEVPVTLDTAPGANSRIDAIVAYVDNPPQGSESTADNPEACGIIPVAGTPAADPQAPDDNAIRTAITADGASGTTAYYVILATVTIPTGTTDLISGCIQQGDKAVLNSNQIGDGSITSSKIDWTTSEITTVTPSSSIQATFRPDWYRKELGNGVVKYWLNFSFNVYTQGSTWAADRSVALPVTFDASKMTASVCANADDAAIIITPAFRNNYFSINRYNASQSSITVDVHVQAEITVFS